MRFRTIVLLAERSLKEAIAPSQLSTFRQAILQQHTRKAPFSYRKMLTAWSNQYNLPLPLSWRSDLSFGWQYIRRHPALMKLLLYYGMLILFLGALQVLFTPFFLILGTPRTLGIALSIGGIGWLLGSLTMGVWGWLKNRVNGILAFATAQELWLMLAGFKASIPLTIIAIFGYLFTYPLISSCNQSLWQSHIPREIQGHVFSIKLMVEWLFLPVGYLAAGVLCDRIFEPLMAINGPLSQSIGQVIGTGPGRGIALFCRLMGSTILGLTLWVSKDNDLR